MKTISVACIITMIVAGVQPAYAEKPPAAPMPATGQTTSIAVGDDGDLQTGVPLPKPRFKDNNDGTVTDRLTGLVWLRYAACNSNIPWATALDASRLLTDGQCGLTIIAKPVIGGCRTSAKWIASSTTDSLSQQYQTQPERPKPPSVIHSLTIPATRAARTGHLHTLSSMVRPTSSSFPRVMSGMNMAIRSLPLACGQSETSKNIKASSRRSHEVFEPNDPTTKRHHNHEHHVDWRHHRQHVAVTADKRTPKDFATYLFRMVSLLVIAFGLLGGVCYGQTLGDWQVATNGSALFAGLINDSGQSFGQFCSVGDGDCYWVISLPQACEKGDKYPVLANSDVAAVHLSVSCKGQLDGGRYGYAFTDFDRIDSLLMKASRAVGFAIPLPQNQFLVVRFNLRGAAAAISTMRAAFESRAKPAAQGTRGQRM